MNILGRLRRKFYKLTHPIVGEVWMFHRVVKQRSDIRVNADIEVTEDFFSDMISRYRRLGYEFISLDELSTRLREKKTSRTKFVCVTFDDGYRDNYEIAYPLLKKYNVPFAIYVTNDFYEKKAVLWWYVLDDLIEKRYQKLSKEECDEIFCEWHEQLISLAPNEVKHRICDEFSQDESIFDAKVEQLAMDREHVIALSEEPLCTIAAHTISHIKLDALSYEQQEYEIRRSKELLETLIGREVRHFSYPFGAYNNDTIDIVSKVGFDTVTKAWGYAVRYAANPLYIDRIPIRQK